MRRKSEFGRPEGCDEVLLHACCAPCSSAIVEWMVEHGVRPTIFYYNPNIWPRDEYDIRKNESKRHAEGLGIRWIDGDYDHERWRQDVCGLEAEPERGRRCEQCFTLRLTATARKAKELGLRWFATTLASSRWKSLEQIERAGHQAETAVPGVTFWAQNWRKGGLYERRNQLLKAYSFYNQQYCGCEFSAGRLDKAELRQRMRLAVQRHAEQLSPMSAAIVERLRERLQEAKVVMTYWPLKDEVDIRPLIDELVAEGKTVLLPRVTGDDTMVACTYTSRADLREGAFHILEPSGVMDDGCRAMDDGCWVLVPGMAFDAAGHRLGRGKGYYDRFLGSHPGLRTIGVCFPFQRVAVVPVNAHDVPVDEVI